MGANTKRKLVARESELSQPRAAGGRGSYSSRQSGEEQCGVVCLGVRVAPPVHTSLRHSPATPCQASSRRRPDGRTTCGGRTLPLFGDRDVPVAPVREPVPVAGAVPLNWRAGTRGAYCLGTYRSGIIMPLRPWNIAQFGALLPGSGPA